MKVSYLGETKRIKSTNSYEALALQTRDTFKNGLERVWPIRFYYLDEDNELISISSQTDFQEALDDFNNLKLIVANNVSEAREQLSKLLSESAALSESLNQSSFLRQSTMNFANTNANHTIMRPFDMGEGLMTDRTATQNLIKEMEPSLNKQASPFQPSSVQSGFKTESLPVNPVSVPVPTT